MNNPNALDETIQLVGAAQPADIDETYKIIAPQYPALNEEGFTPPDIRFLFGGPDNRDAIKASVRVFSEGRRNDPTLPLTERAIYSAADGVKRVLRKLLRYGDKNS